MVGHVDRRDDVPTLGESALPSLLGRRVGGTGIVLAGEGGALVVLLLMELVPLAHGVGVSVMLRVVVLVEEVVLVPHLVLGAGCVGNRLRVAQLGLLDRGSYERMVLKFSFFCLLPLNRLLCLRQGAERGVLVSGVQVLKIGHSSQLGLLKRIESLVALRMIVLLSSLFK